MAFGGNPDKLGRPSFDRRARDPFRRDRDATGNILRLHVGSSPETIVHRSACSTALCDPSMLRRQDVGAVEAVPPEMDSAQADTGWPASLAA